MVRSIRIHFRIIRGLLRDVNSITGHYWIVGVRKFPYGLGLAYFSMSFTRSAGPPIAGWIYDSFHSYKVPFLYTGFVIFTGCFISFLVSLLQERNTRTEADDTSNLQSTGVDRETDV